MTLRSSSGPGVASGAASDRSAARRSSSSRSRCVTGRMRSSASGASPSASAVAASLTTSAGAASAEAVAPAPAGRTGWTAAPRSPRAAASARCSDAAGSPPISTSATRSPRRDPEVGQRVRPAGRCGRPTRRRSSVAARRRRDGPDGARPPRPRPSRGPSELASRSCSGAYDPFRTVWHVCSRGQGSVRSVLVADRLSPTSYVVLGMIALRGPSTSYDLKRAVGRSIGYFWHFPHAQLYSEPERLVELGLLDAETEAEGRRRRDVLVSPRPGAKELRDVARRADARALPDARHRRAQAVLQRGRRPGRRRPASRASRSRAPRSGSPSTRTCRRASPTSTPSPSA